MPCLSQGVVALFTLYRPITILRERPRNSQKRSSLEKNAVEVLSTNSTIKTAHSAAPRGKFSKARLMARAAGGIQSGRLKPLSQKGRLALLSGFFRYLGMMYP